MPGQAASGKPEACRCWPPQSATEAKSATGSASQPLPHSESIRRIRKGSIWQAHLNYRMSWSCSALTWSQVAVRCSPLQPARAC